jgi:hypothetical protein
MFAKLALEKPGLLILDEPTNHINFRHLPIPQVLNGLFLSGNSYRSIEDPLSEFCIPLMVNGRGRSLNEIRFQHVTKICNS